MNTVQLFFECDGGDGEFSIHYLCNPNNILHPPIIWPNWLNRLNLHSLCWDHFKWQLCLNGKRAARSNNYMFEFQFTAIRFQHKSIRFGHHLNSPKRSLQLQSKVGHARCVGVDALGGHESDTRSVH